jgi:hypothetical protein
VGVFWAGTAAFKTTERGPRRRRAVWPPHGRRRPGEFGGIARAAPVRVGDLAMANDATDRDIDVRDVARPESAPRMAAPPHRRKRCARQLSAAPGWSHVCARVRTAAWVATLPAQPGGPTLLSLPTVPHAGSRPVISYNTVPALSPSAAAWCRALTALLGRVSPALRDRGALGQRSARSSAIPVPSRTALREGGLRG